MVDKPKFKFVKDMNYYKHRILQNQYLDFFLIWKIEVLCIEYCK